MPESTADRRFRDLLDRLPQTVFEFDLEGRITYVNRTGLETFGYTAEDVRGGLTVFQMIVPEQREQGRENLRRRIEGGPPEYQEYTAQRRDGSTFPVLIHSSPVLSEGRPVGLHGFLIDISARARSDNALQQSERKYRALVETTATGYVILDPLGLVLDANAEYLRMSGRGALREIAGRSVVEWTAVRDRARNARAVQACFEQGCVRNLQVDYVRPDGTFVPVEINATVVEVDGAPQIISVVRDISDRKHLEVERLRSEKLRSISVLAGGIAHDFNNILTAVLGNISLIRTNLSPGGQAAELLAEAERASLRARDLTQQLLTFSRGGSPVRKVIDPGAVVREAVSLALRGRGSVAELSLAPGLWSIEADEGQIGQVINNLVINASQAMAGRGVVKVAVANVESLLHGRSTLPEGRYVEISVADSGTGVPEEHRARIFDPYFTTKEDGSGLGLAVCFSIIANHGGTIELASKTGSGSVFTVYLPSTGSAGAATPAVAGEVKRGRGRVLVMDDERMVRTIAGKIIEALGYEAVLVSDGREALAAWERERSAGRPFDLAIVDLTVPGGMGGAEMIPELLALDQGAKVIVSSGYHQDPIMARFREYGFADVIKKPYGVAEISTALANALEAG